MIPSESQSRNEQFVSKRKYKVDYTKVESTFCVDNHSFHDVLSIKKKLKVYGN